MRLSDYKGEEAIDLWLDLLDPIYGILKDVNVANQVKSGQSPIKIAQSVLKNHKTEAIEILERIDPTPVDGISIVIRLADLFKELGEREETKAFFGYAEEARTQLEQPTLPTVSTEGEEN